MYTEWSRKGGSEREFQGAVEGVEMRRPGAKVDQEQNGRKDRRCLS